MRETKPRKTGNKGYYNLKCYLINTNAYLIRREIPGRFHLPEHTTEPGKMYTSITNKEVKNNIQKSSTPEIS